MFLYNQIEVVKTGRFANKLSKDKTRIIDTLYEITPASSEVDTWTKWVRDTDLYIINDKNDRR